MADLSTIANIAEIFGALTIIGGVVFAVIQIREFRVQRRQRAAVELMRSFHDPDLVLAISLIRQLPDGVSAKDLRSKGAEYERAAIMISTTYESIALLLFRKMISFNIVCELTGGLAVVMWRKLAVWADTVREEQRQPSWAEWFQWLAVILAREAEHKEVRPAKERFANWRPRD
mgnify:CR=1 FL=1